MPDRSAFLKLARDRFKLAQTAEKDQRQRELDDLRFYAGDQWPDDLKRLRSGQQADANTGIPAVPARPCMTLVGNTREPVRQVLNQERQADMGISIVPADDFGDVAGPIDETEIHLREGLVRRIQRDSTASDARTWAFARATIAGRGDYAVMTRYAPGKTNDQEIYIHRFWNQSCVTRDPAHEQPDGSDAEWVQVGNDYTQDAYDAEFGKRNGKTNRVYKSSDADWRALGDEQPEWFTTEGDVRMIRVIDYWYTEYTSRDLVSFALESDPRQQRVEWVDEIEGEKALPELVADLAGWIEVPKSRRSVVEKSIKWAKIDGCDDDVLDETDWPGPDMPIIKVLGEELQPYDKQRRVEGMVRPMREPQQGLNYMVSRWVEVVGLAPLTPAMVEEGTIEGYEAWWEAANTRTLPYLPYKKNLEGQPANPPTVPPARTPPIEPLAMSVQMFKEAVQDSSGYHGPSLGKVDPSIKSGRAIKALQEQASQGSNHYLDNLQRSIRYEAQVINNLLYPIYGRPGRLARIVNGENQPETVLLHQPFVMQGGKPMPVEASHPQAKTYTLTKDAKFNVVLKVSKNYDSRRAQEAEIVGNLIAQNPELMTVFGDLYFENLDGPGHQQMAERAKVMLAPPVQQLLASKAAGSQLPPEVQAQVGQMQQQIQQLTAQLQEVGKPTAVEEVKQQGAQAIKAADLDFQREKLHVESETKLAVAELGAKVDRMALLMEEIARVGAQGHEVGEAARGRAHDAGMAAMDHAATADEAQRAREDAAAQAEAGRAHEAAMASAGPQSEG